MVQLVFVHGVGTRTGAAYDQESANRDALFAEVLFRGLPLVIESPRWGDLVTPLGGKAFADPDGVASFHSGLDRTAEVEGDRLAVVAQQDPGAAIDAIFAETVEAADEGGLSPEQIEAFRLAVDALSTGDLPADVRVARTDEELLFAVSGIEGPSYGVRQTLRGAVAALGDRARDFASDLVTPALRDKLNPTVGRFLGDIFVFLKPGPQRDDIRRVVREAVTRAHGRAKERGEPLVLVGHSLGGVILYDLLSSATQSGLPEDLNVAVFATVGSQPGLFEEMQLFDFRQGSGGATPGPACVGKWLNVFDPTDVLAFRTKDIFADAEDFQFDSVTGLLSAHTTYFKRPKFYARFRARLRELGVIPTS